MILLDEKFKNKEAVTIPNLQFAVVDVYSVTMFQHFLDAPGFASSVREGV
jgi:hypothetical protein